MNQWENQPLIADEELKFDDILAPEEVKDKDPDNIFKPTALFPAEDVDKPISQMVIQEDPAPIIQKNEPTESPINNLLETPQSLDLDYDKINEMAEKIA